MKKRLCIWKRARRNIRESRQGERDKGNQSYYILVSKIKRNIRVAQARKSLLITLLGQVSLGCTDYVHEWTISQYTSRLATTTNFKTQLLSNIQKHISQRKCGIYYQLQEGVLYKDVVAEGIPNLTYISLGTLLEVQDEANGLYFWDAPVWEQLGIRTTLWIIKDLVEMTILLGPISGRRVLVLTGITTFGWNASTWSN